MLIKHFVARTKRLSRGSRMTVWRPSGASSLSHEGVTYAPDENGWIEVPREVGETLRQLRAPGRFFTPDDVDEATPLGTVRDEPVAPVAPGRRSLAPSKGV
jgi:hypothetical protein